MSQSPSPASPAAPSLLARLLKMVADVEPFEARAVILSMLYFLFLFGSYSVVKPVRDAMGTVYGVKHLQELFTATLLASLVFEGVFEQFPQLRVCLIECGFTWVPALCWRMDRQWQRYRAEVPHLKRLPSEYVREHVWFATQPIEEPENPAHLTDIIDWLGWERLVFSTDYPHWHFEGEHALPDGLPEETMRRMLVDNPLATYPRLGGATKLTGTGAVTEETMP